MDKSLHVDSPVFPADSTRYYVLNIALSVHVLGCGASVAESGDVRCSV